MSFLAQILPKKDAKESFLTLALTDDSVRAAIAQVSGATITVVGTAHSDIHQERNLLAAADMAITEAEQQMTEKTPVKQVVFALPPQYLHDDQIKPEYLETLKTLSHELDLTPRGFIEYPSALSYFLEQDEGSPPTLLLIAITRQRLTFTLLRLGKVQQQVEVKPTDSFSTDFTSALSLLSAEILPSRIILFDNGTPLEDTRDALSKFSWHKHAQFLHTPKIEIFPTEKVMTALIEAGASSFLRKLPHPHEIAPADSPQPVPVQPAVEATMIQEPPAPEHTTHHEKHHETHHEEHHETHHGTHHEVHHEKHHEEPREHHQPLHRTHEELLHRHLHPPEDEPEHVPHAFEDISGEEEKPQKAGWRFKLPSNPFSRGIPRIPFLSGGLLIMLPFLVLAGGIGFLYWYVPKSTVSLIVYPYSASQTVDVLFSTTANQTSGDSPVILVREVTKEIQGERTAATTGKGNAGEKAKGSVTVYNKTTSGKTLPKGTVLLHGDLRFTLDDAVNLASASDTGEGLAFGKTSVAVTAGSIGPQSNIPAGSTFTFKDFPESSYTAKNTSGFAGGTSREVTSVSKEDQTKLEEQLMKQLLAQSKQEIAQTVSAGEKLIDETLEMETVSKKFSQDVGSEAKEVTLTVNLRVTARAYREEELNQLAQTTFPSPPEGFMKSPRTVTAAIDKMTNEKNGTNRADVRITAYFLPLVDTPSIQQQLAGKSFDEVKSYATKFPSVGGMKIQHQTVLPGMEKRLPLRKDNITIETVVY